MDAYNAWVLVYLGINHPGGGGGGIFGAMAASAPIIGRARSTATVVLTASTIAVSSSITHPLSLSMRHFFSAMLL